MAAEAGSLASKYEEFCESLKATPPPWVRAEIDGATAYVLLPHTHTDSRAPSSLDSLPVRSLRSARRFGCRTPASPPRSRLVPRPQRGGAAPAERR